MKIIRQITYEFPDREALDMQMGRSLPDGVRTLNRITGAWISIVTLQDDRQIVNVFPGVKLKEDND